MDLDLIIFHDNGPRNPCVKQEHFSSCTYFPDGTVNQNKRELHVYIYESFYCAIHYSYSDSFIGKWFRILDIIYFYLHGHAIFELALLEAIMLFRNEHLNLNMPQEPLSQEAKDLLLKYHVFKYGKYAKFKYVTLYHMYFIRFIFAKSRLIKWMKRVEDEHKKT